MLTTAHIHDRKVDRAVGELMANARRLAAAGFAAEAYAALGALLQEGPWRLPMHGLAAQQLKRLLPSVSLLAGEPCPAVGDQAAMTAAEQAEWAEREAAAQISSVAMVVRHQQRPAGAAWSPAFLDSLVDAQGPPGDPRPGAAFGEFCVDAECVLKERVGRRFPGAIAPVEIPTDEDLEALGLPPESWSELREQLLRAGRIDVAAAAAEIETADIARAASNYLRSTGRPGGYLADFIFHACWLLLLQDGMDAEALEVAALWLSQHGSVPEPMIDCACLPAVRRFLREGRLAQALGVDAQAARAWLQSIASRRSAEPTKPAAVSVVRHGREELLRCVQETPLAPMTWMELAVPGSGEQAWICRVPVEQRKQLWLAARALVARTGRWPLVTTFWGDHDDPPDAGRIAEDIFMRFPYESGPARDDLSPTALIADSHAAKLEMFLAELGEGGYSPDRQALLQQWQYECQAQGLKVDDLDRAFTACGNDRVRFERWLAEQEAVQGQSDPARGRDRPFEPDTAWLLLLPTPHSEDALAYAHWFGMERGPAEGFIALLRQWRQRYGAELFAHYGTMLEFVVSRPPEDLDAALQLAVEHECVAPCTLALPGTALRHYAVGLIGHETWFLHERP